jgi:hypothetical protein
LFLSFVALEGLVAHAVYDLFSLSKLKSVHICGQVSISFLFVSFLFFSFLFFFVMVASESLNVRLTEVFLDYQNGHALSQIKSVAEKSSELFKRIHVYPDECLQIWRFLA